ncbi:MAG: hypothetical protein ABEJ31_04230 [Haloarculaceae archaeon]
MARSDLTTDRDEIERWADERDAVPVREGDRVRLVPESAVTAEHDRLDWDDFHREVGDDHVVQRFDEDERAEMEVTDRESALEQVTTEEDIDRDEVEQRLIEGETITGTITETTVVEETIVEQATLESEVVDSRVVDRSITNLELLERTCDACDVVDADLTGAWYDDTDRFLADPADVQTGAEEAIAESPFDVTVQVEEDWAATIEERLQYTIETRVTDVDVTETETIDSQDLEAEIDIDDVHDRLRSGELIDFDAEAEGGVIDSESYDMESEFSDDDTIVTTLTSARAFDREVTERRLLTTEVVASELLSIDVDEDAMRTGDLDTAGTTVMDTDADADIDVDADDDLAAADLDDDLDDVRVMPDDDDVGKPVVVPTGDQVGMVTAVEDGVAYVDPHPGLTEKVSAALGWGGADEEDFVLDDDRIDRITNDAVRLSGDFDADELEDVDDLE